MITEAAFVALRAIAGRLMRKQRSCHTLQPAQLVADSGDLAKAGFAAAAGAEEDVERREADGTGIAPGLAALRR